MDLEAESIVTVDTAATKDIAESCNKLLQTQEELQKVEEQVKKLKKIRNLSYMYYKKLQVLEMVVQK